MIANRTHCGASIALLALFATSASAAVLAKYQYRLGEDDPGAVAGGTGQNPTRAFVGGAARIKISAVGGQSYSSDVPSLTTTGSTLAMDFSVFPNQDGYGGINGAFNGNSADNYVFETWVKSTEAGGDSLIAYAGDLTGAATGTAGGLGFFQSGPSYTARFPNIGEFVLAPTSTSNWTHLAIVRDSAAGGGNNQGLRAYVNGVQIALPSMGAAPLPVAGNLEIGGSQFAGLVFNGKVDDVRYSTFASGSFVPGDLLVIPEPASLAAVGLCSLFMLHRRRV